MDFKHEENGSAGLFTATEEGHTAELSYTVSDGANVMAFDHTFVPVAARGRGLARKLVDHAVDHARRNAMTVAPHCSYVSALFDRHPERYADIDARKTD